ncbi:uncharacterized protein LY79DRAFT_571013 [Colletotrichum navitas]|uniref:Uncharacterized protein n=1 Tax=Colletotrichum navitas TaxID=681940 RepID=A0AAD8PL96_9PEZI|nr:uncharacterized protein LY79DRAFT_571013 [Colletotrichum navitas]KAK1569878.1 hypothetical protein LY79DRAFT_571013 [Colletotrichum navitas]
MGWHHRYPSRWARPGWHRRYPSRWAGITIAHRDGLASPQNSHMCVFSARTKK